MTTFRSKLDTNAVGELAMAFVNQHRADQKASILVPAYALALAVYFVDHSLDDAAITKIMEAMVKDVVKASRLIRESCD